MLSIGILSLGQTTQAQPPDSAINFPDLPGFQTLKTELHIHTVVSDDYVELSFDVINSIIAPVNHPTLTVKAAVTE